MFLLFLPKFSNGSKKRRKGDKFVVRVYLYCSSGALALSAKLLFVIWKWMNCKIYCKNAAGFQPSHPSLLSPPQGPKFTFAICNSSLKGWTSPPAPCELFWFHLLFEQDILDCIFSRVSMNSTLLHTIDFICSWKIALHILSINCTVSRLGFFCVGGNNL